MTVTEVLAILLGSLVLFSIHFRIRSNERDILELKSNSNKLREASLLMVDAMKMLEDGKQDLPETSADGK